MPKGRVKYVLAGIGAVYAIVFVGYLVYAGLNRKGPGGPSELELHPEKQAEIRARERAEQLRDRLKLSDEQTRKLAEIFQKHPPMDGPPVGDPRERFRALHDEISNVLTPEQQAIEDQMRPGGPGGPGGPGRGPGGPPGFMNPERMEALKQAMTPEQRERFEKQLEKMRQRMPFGPGGRRPQPPPSPPQ